MAGWRDPEEIRMPTPEGTSQVLPAAIRQGPASILEFSKPPRRQQHVGVRFHSWRGSLAMRTLARVSPEIEGHCCQLSRGVSHAEQRPPGWLLRQAGLAEGLQKDEPSGAGAI